MCFCQTLANISDPMWCLCCASQIPVSRLCICIFKPLFFRLITAFVIRYCWISLWLDMTALRLLHRSAAELTACLSPIVSWFQQPKDGLLCLHSELLWLCWRLTADSSAGRCTCQVVPDLSDFPRECKFHTTHATVTAALTGNIQASSF